MFTATPNSTSRVPMIVAKTLSIAGAIPPSWPVLAEMVPNRRDHEPEPHHRQTGPNPSQQGLLLQRSERASGEFSDETDF
ncbi:MAG: hypothetical protein U0872_15565 [Planctomycetaceae bacterium]